MYYTPNKRLHYRLGGQQKNNSSAAKNNLPVILCAMSALFALIAALTGIAKRG